MEINTIVFIILWFSEMDEFTEITQSLPLNCNIASVIYHRDKRPFFFYCKFCLIFIKVSKLNLNVKFPNAKKRKEKRFVIKYWNQAANNVLNIHENARKIDGSAPVAPTTCLILKPSYFTVNQRHIYTIFFVMAEW